MNIDRRVTNGLAWAGVLLVVGIPAADLVSAQFMGDRAPQQIAMVEPVAPIPAPLSQRPAAPVAAAPAAEVAVAAPAPVAPAVVVKPAAAQTSSVVDSYLQSGKGLPSYITDAPGASPTPAPIAATTPARPQIITPTTASGAPVTPTAPTDPMQVASIPAKVAPVPMPLSMRPSAAFAPVAATVPGNDVIVIPPSGGPVPPANVTAADLEDWETGPLSDFLARRQQLPRQAEVDPAYDADGFFLDEGPDRPRRRDRLVGPADAFYFPFVN